MKKRIGFFLFALLLTGVLTACGGESKNSDSEEYDSSNAVSVVFSENEIEVSEEDGCQISGTDLTIGQSGTYLVSGSCGDGSVTVKKGTEDVTIVLNGISLTSADSAPLVCGKNSRVDIVAASGTTNTLADTEANNDETHPENTEAENAVLKCKDGSAVTLRGAGTLSIEANGKNAIKAGAASDETQDTEFVIRELMLSIDASVNDGIHSEIPVRIQSGMLSIQAADDAIHSDDEITIGEDGSDGPEIAISDCYEGIEALLVNALSGTVTIHSEDDCINAANSERSDYPFAVCISGGEFRMDSTSGDGIDSNGTIEISGGTVLVWTANRADNQPLDADGEIAITGGTLLAAGGSSGMGMKLSGTQAYAAFGNTAFSSPMNGGGMSGERPEMPQMSGREKPERNGEMPPEPPSGKPGDFAGGDFPGGGAETLLVSGSAFTIADADGEVLYSGTALCDAGYVFFSAPKCGSGSSLTLTAGEDVVSTADSVLPDSKE